MNRRDFLKLAGMGSAGLVAATLYKRKPPKKRKNKMTVQNFGATSSGYQTIAQYEWTHIIQPGDLIGSLVGISIFGNATVLSVTATLGGVERDVQYRRADPNGVDCRTEIWDLSNMLPGTYTMNVQLDAAIASVSGISSYQYFGGVGRSDGHLGVGIQSIEIDLSRKNSIMFNVLAVRTVTGVLDATGQNNRWKVGGALGSGLGSDEGPDPALNINDVISMTYTGIGGADPFAMTAAEVLDYIPNPPAIMGL